MLEQQKLDEQSYYSNGGESPQSACSTGAAGPVDRRTRAPVEKRWRGPDLKTS
jgi:hypothetical protein